MNCPSCGRDVTGKKFCPMCGHAVPPAEDKPKAVCEHSAKKSTNSTFIIICIISTVAVLAICVGAFFAMRAFNQRDLKAQPKYQEDVKAPVKEEKPETSEFARLSTYNMEYTYKGMEGIHFSSEADDKTSHRLSDAVKTFNNSWIEFVNNGDRKVFNYLKEGTQAYKYAVAYGDKDITEEYILMEVNDVRQDGSIYYVWTHEIIEEHSEASLKEKVRYEYYWVYKVAYSDGGYYVEDYIRDPAYK